MHLALQFLAHSPHELHFETSITGLKSGCFDKNPRTVPTGQTVLQ